MSMYLWFKAVHIIAMVAWFAGLFYLPRLFVYHADAEDAEGVSRFKVMERRLYYAITWPAALITTLFGLGIIGINPLVMKSGWMHAKLALVLALWTYHLTCGYFVKRFARNHNLKSSRFYRFFNEVPTVLLITIVILAVVKPF